MRLRTAIPILLTSSSAMVACLGIALAQEGEPPVVTIPGQPPVLRPPLQAPIGSEALKALRAKRRGGTRPADGEPVPAAPTPSGPPANLPPGTPPTAPTAGTAEPGAGGGTVTGITPFETGLDYEPTPPGSRVTFNLEDAELSDLVRLISNLTGKRFIISGKARSIKATVYAPTKVSVGEAYRAFLAILEANGMTVVPSGRYLKIQETSGIETQPVPLYIDDPNTPGDDRYITRLQPVNNVSAEDAAQLLGRFKSREASVTAYEPTNTLIITDTGTNIQRMLRILGAVDVPRAGEQIWIEPVHYANASELATRLEEIFNATGTMASATKNTGSGRPTPTPPRPPNVGPDSPTTPGSVQTVGSRGRGEARITKILPEERTNSLIILATERAYMRILELIRQLDVPLEGDGRVHVHYLQHGDAEDIAATISSLAGGSSGRPSGGGPGAARPGGASGGAPVTAASGDLFEGEIRVTAHKATNSLVITSSMHDYASLRRVISQLDTPRRQVFIEAVIMELSAVRNQTVDLGWHGGVPEFPASGTTTLFGWQGGMSAMFPGQTQADLATTLQGLAFGVRGPTLSGSQDLIGMSIPGFGVALRAIADTNDANVLATPHIVALDNVEAEISVGGNVPLQTNIPSFMSQLAGAGTGGAAGLGALAGLGGMTNSGRQDVGTTLRVTPHINDSDEVRLEIEEEISEAGEGLGDLGAVPINKRNAKTELVVRDGETVVIGGLMRDVTGETVTRVPILGELPIIGMLFRKTVSHKEKRNLILFLTPYIIRSNADLRAIFERKMRERQEFIDRYMVFSDIDYSPPVDYSRTRGMVAEILRELDRMADEQRLAEELAARPPPEHRARPPVGAAADLGVSGDDGGGVVINPGDAPPSAPIQMQPMPDGSHAEE